MLHFLKHFNKEYLYAPIEGESIPLEKVPDVVFAEKIVGDGIAIIPNGGKVVAPCDGIVTKMFQTNHGIAIKTKEGTEVLIHIGIDTVYLKGNGFIPVVKAGDTIKTGMPILIVDWDLVKIQAKSSITPIIITNSEKMSVVQRYYGKIKAGTSPIIKLKKS